MSKEAKEAKKKTKKQKGETAAETNTSSTADEAQKREPFFHKRKGGDFLHSKAMFFGGGFYGTMALFTYLIVEVDEILKFFGKIVDFSNWHFSFSMQFVIDLIINSIMNVVAAFIWFTTLPNYVDVHNGFAWLIAAYLGYLGGVRFTQEKGDEAWQFLSTELQNIKGKLTLK